MSYLRRVPIPYGRQAIDDDDIEAVTEVLRGDWLTQGPAVREFEEAVAASCQVDYAVAFSSGTAALHGAAFAAGVTTGTELVTSAITFAATANCGAYLGAVPRFADIEPDTWNVSARTIADALTENTAAVLPVHFTGLPAPVEEIRQLVGDGVRVIEDAAHALGAHTGDEPVGSCLHSDMAIFSFHPVKTIASGEGGMVTTRDPELRDRLALFRTHGITRDPALLEANHGGWYQEQHTLGFNYRLSDIHSALGRSQLRKLDRFVERRNRIAERYRHGLGDLEHLELAPAAGPGARHAYHLFVVRDRRGAEARRLLYDGLRERDILAQVHYLPVYLHPYYRRTYGYEPGLCPVAERYYAGCLSLPCYPTLTEAEQDEVIAAVRELGPA
jgi:perosamine synthetase